jgi:hypothetical protein
MAFGDVSEEHLALAQLLGFHRGLVADNKDPEKLGRIRALIPGLLSDGQMSAWAWPAGMPFSGGNQRGGYMPPPLNAQVFIGHVLGDRHEPFYITGNWGNTQEGATGIPTAAAEQTANDAPSIKTIQTDTFQITIIDKDDEKKLRIQTTDTDQAGFIELDAVDGSIHISARNWLVLEGAGVSVDGTAVYIKERIVQSPAAKPTI